MYLLILHFQHTKHCYTSDLLSLYNDLKNKMKVQPFKILINFTYELE